MPLAAFKQVTKTYDEGGDAPAQTVLDKVDLEVEAGTTLAIIGPSGSGKSTALNLLGALDTPTSGSVLFEDRDLAGLDERAQAQVRSRRLGFIFQDHHLLPQITVRENVLLPTLALGGVADDSHRQRADELLDRVGLSDRGNDWPRHLSGGERQRVAVVRSLINRPPLVLADEPTGALDHRTADALADLLVEINKEMGTALVVVTHQIDQAERMDRVLELRDGTFHDYRAADDD
jgi:lipoprotein-releasing system ATP-binding protein